MPRPTQYRFSASWTKAKMPNSEHNVTGLPTGYDGKADNWQCKLRLTNSNTVPLQKLVVVYQVDVLRDRNMGDKTDRLIASHVVDAMKPGESVEITTKPLELARIVLKKGYVSKSGGNRTAPMTDTIRGMAVKVVDTGMEAWHWESPGVINKIELPSSVKPATTSK